MRTLGTTFDGFRLAKILVPYLPLAIEADLANAEGCFNKEPSLQETIMRARPRMAAVQRTVQLREMINNAWLRRNLEVRYSDATLKQTAWLANFAVRIAESKDAPLYFSWSESVRYLHLWWRITDHTFNSPDFPYYVQDPGDEILQNLIHQARQKSLRCHVTR